MRTINLMHHPLRSKKAVIGGPLARAIYGAGGLAERLRAARAHNKAAFQGRNVNEDGTRTYRLVEMSASERCKFCGRWTVGDDGECRFCAVFEVCPECHCAVGSDAQTTVDDLTITCHCDCHHYDDEEVVYSGKRFVVRDGEQVEAWEVYRNGEQFILSLEGSTFSLFEWGSRCRELWRDGYTNTGASLLAWVLYSDALGKDQREAVPAAIISIFILRVVHALPDFWSMTRSDVLELIRSFEAEEARYV